MSEQLNTDSNKGDPSPYASMTRQQLEDTLTYSAEAGMRLSMENKALTEAATKLRREEIETHEFENKKLQLEKDKEKETKKKIEYMNAKEEAEAKIGQMMKQKSEDQGR
jgi:hypothetical protein